MAVVEGTTVKLAASIASAGLIATISRDPDFWVLFGSAILISTASYTYDMHRYPKPYQYVIHFMTWFKYVVAGLAVMFLTFNGLVSWVHEEWQLPVTVWYFVSITVAGYGMQIIEKIKQYGDPLIDKFIARWFK